MDSKKRSNKKIILIVVGTIIVVVLALLIKKNNIFPEKRNGLTETQRQAILEEVRNNSQGSGNLTQEQKTQIIQSLESSN